MVATPEAPDGYEWRPGAGSRWVLYQLRYSLVVGWVDVVGDNLFRITYNEAKAPAEKW